MKKLTLFSLVLSVLLISCNNGNISNEELFNKYYQKNIDKCVKIMLKNDIDSTIALKKCGCFLNSLYEIDSSFVRKSPKEIDSLIKKNKEKIDSICN